MSSGIQLTIRFCLYKLLVFFEFNDYISAFTALANELCIMRIYTRQKWYIGVNPVLIYCWASVVRRWPNIKSTLVNAYSACWVYMV